MSGPLYVQTDGVRSYAQIHDEVIAGLSQVTGSAVPEALGVQDSHGPIATAVSAALGQVLGSRQGTLQNTSMTGQTISDLLQKAAQMYEQGDRAAADKLKAAAAALEQSDAVGGGGAGAPSGAPSSRGGSTGAAGSAGAGGGADQTSQMVSQVGQQVGQMAQMAAQSVQGLMQGLVQLPQQVMQGVQGMVQSAGQAGGAGTSKADADKAESAKRDDKGKDRDPQHERREAAPSHRDEAQPGKSAELGRAPEPPPVKHAEPAQTRPQQSPL